MNKINSFKKLKNKIKKLLAVFTVFCLAAISSQIKTYTHIPLKGLFEVLKYDDIGFAHALLHSKWIENMYQYGQGKPHRKILVRKNRTRWKAQEKKDAVANLVRKFWFKKSENHQLLPTKFGCLANIPNGKLGKVFGKLINCLYLSSSSGQVKSNREEALIDELVKYDLEYEQFKLEIAMLLREVDSEECKLENERFNTLKEAKKIEKEERKKTEVRYANEIDGRKKALFQARQECKKKGEFSKAKKEIDQKFKWGEYLGVLKETRKNAFEGIAKEIQSQYSKIQMVVKKSDAAIVKMVKRKRDAIKKQLFEPIEKALEFCKKNRRYASRTTESILWALFFHKLDDVISREEKIKVINDCLQEIDEEYKNEKFQNKKILTELYTPEELYVFKKDIKKLDANAQIKKTVVDDYDLALHFLINKLAGEKFPPAVSQGSFGYEYEQGRITCAQSNCYETAMHDLFSILWYNPEKKCFDNSLFDQDIIHNGQGFARFRQALAYLCIAGQKKIDVSRYTCQNGWSKFVSLVTLEDIIRQEDKDKEVTLVDERDISVQLINSSEMQQAFMNIVSNIPGIKYDSKDNDKKFELRPSVENFVALCNYFYGTEAKSVEELGKKEGGISTKDREILFEYQKADDIEKIKITVRDKKNNAYFDMTVNIEPKRHAYITVDGRKKTASQVFKEEAVKNLLGSLDNFRHITIFSLLASQEFLENEKFICDPSILHLMYYSCMLRDPQVKLGIIKDVLKRPFEYYDNCKGMIHNLLEEFPLDDASLTEKLIEVMAESLSFNGKKCYGRYLFGEVLSNAMKKGYIGIVFSIINNPKFNLEKYRVGVKHQFTSLLRLALRNSEYKDIASRMLEKAPCWFLEDVGYFAVVHKENEALVLRIVSDSKFDSPCCGIHSCLGVAMEYGYKRVVATIVKKPGFGTNGYKMNDILLLAVKKGYDEIAVTIFKKSEAGRFKINEIFLLAIENGCKKVVSMIFNTPDVHFERYTLVDALEIAIKKEYKKTALAIVNHSEFKPLTLLDIDIHFFTLMFEKNYQEIILAIVENPQWYSKREDDIELVLCFFLLFLKKRCRDIVLQIVNNPGFDSFLVEIMLGLIKKYEQDIDIDEEYKQEKQEVIKILKHKQSKKRDEK